VLGPFLRWKHARTVLQLVLLGLAALVILDGLFGPQLAAKNLAGILPWVHWRGFVALALLVAGNLFCMACPFMLTRRPAKRLFRADRHWPRVLRTKWFALGLLFLFLWAYEAFDLWASPWLTAWLALAYFAAAFVIDAFFRGAAFCKYVCPIGHFHFVNSLASPVEVAVREPEVCGECRTRDCIVGRYEEPRALVPPGVGGNPEPSSEDHRESGETARARARGRPLPPGERGKLLQSGCELWLYQETKGGNMDCTFCMECIQACPYDNVGIVGRVPARELWEDPRRAGVGRFSQRPDLAALALFLTFAAFMNAFGMVSPVYALEAWMARTLNISWEPAVLGILFLAGMVVIPALLVAVSAWASARLSGSGNSIVRQATIYGYALVPVGFGMWIAHYLFHFLVGGLAIIPATQEYLADLGLPMGGSPAWSLGPVVPESWLLPLEILFLELGLLVSLVVAWRIALRETAHRGRALRATLPWAALALALSAAGVWLLFQPMEMRGTVMG
jgi:polyferredoxin